VVVVVVVEGVVVVVVVVEVVFHEDMIHIMHFYMHAGNIDYYC
jgi:hypothetical protein